MKPLTDAQKKKLYKRAALFGFVLALVCHSLPPHYRTVCEFISNVCTGGN